MIILNQFDQRWAKVEMKPSHLTLGRFGCTTTSICMLSDYFKCFVIPPQAVDENVKYTRDGLVIWEKIKFPRFKFEARIRGADFHRIDTSLKDPKKACILNIHHGAHWVAAVRKLPLGRYQIADPWGGVNRIIRMDEIVGSAHFIAT